MASLENQPIDATYEGLLKTEDNAAITTVVKPLTDGDGNLLPVSVSTLGMTYTGIQDFTGATVTGAGGAAGLVAGTGTNTMRSADTLTAIAANAAGPNSIALGNDAVALGGTSNDGKSLAIGVACKANERNSIAIGHTNTVGSDGCITIGNLQSTSNNRGIMIGVENATNTTGQDKIQLGTLTTALGGDRAIAIGRGSISNSDNSVAIGNTARVLTSAGGGIAIGTGSTVNIGGGDSVAIGAGATTTGMRATAVGRNCKASQNSIAIGNFADVTGTTSIALTSCSVAQNFTRSSDTVMIVPGSNGGGTAVGAAGSIVIGAGNFAQNRSELAGGIAIGDQSRSSGLRAVALGANVLAETTDTVTIKRLQMLDYASLNFVDDAAAATGGIPLGGVYHNAGALRIRIV